MPFPLTLAIFWEADKIDPAVPHPSPAVPLPSSTRATWAQSAAKGTNVPQLEEWPKANPLPVLAPALIRVSSAGALTWEFSQLSAGLCSCALFLFFLNNFLF